MFVAVVDAERQTNELRQYGRPPAPHLDDLVAAAFTNLLGFLEKEAIDKRAFPN